MSDRLVRKRLEVFMLIGARTFTDIRATRSRDQEMWLLKADDRSQPVPLEHTISEIAFQSARSTDPAVVGYGIFLLKVR
jgi:hypothetical protein